MMWGIAYTKGQEMRYPMVSQGSPTHRVIQPIVVREIEGYKIE